MRKLTIGIATHCDYEGLYFSIQAIRMYHKEVLDQLEFVIIDNDPNGPHGELNKKLLTWIKEPIQYLPFEKFKATTVKGKIFDLADTPYVLCMDSHVFIEPGALKKLIDFYDKGEDYGNLLHGPLLYDDGKSLSTHFDLSIWSSYMWGQWGFDPRGDDINNPPFEIPAQGMGLFSTRKDSWLGFNKEFRGFGGEEGYIHEKYRKYGKKVICLPFLRWLHRFDRPNGINYPNILEERFRNYYIGFSELGLDKTELFKEFSQIATIENLSKLDEEIRQFIS
jgi:hypothetical protein